ncbi:MAG: hypothetical protein ISS48_00210 [Candidatus Aenigmarchaeota archaeon]|nr:hypothetical protein [Candidatus Aenigmarchaeota archaeon]
MKKYVLFGFLVFVLSFGVFYLKGPMENLLKLTGMASGTNEGSYNLGIGESIIINGNNIELEDVDSQGKVKFYINSLRYIIDGSGKFAGFEISVLDYTYDDSRVKRKATLSISTYKPTDALMVGERVVTNGKTIILENVVSTGKVRVEIGGTLYEISESGTYEGLEITVDDFYYTDVLENRWAKLSFGCKSHGEILEYTPGDDMSIQCCQGLTHSLQKDLFDENCTNLFEKHAYGGYAGICLACGDGICDSKHESKCNCPEDCGIDIITTTTILKPGDSYNIFQRILIWFFELFKR